MARLATAPAAKQQNRGPRLSEVAATNAHRGGTQLIPRPALFRPGRPAPWWRSTTTRSGHITVADVRGAFQRRGDPVGPPAEVPNVALPGSSRQPAAVLCALFDEGGAAEVVLTRRASGLRSHTSQVSFPGGRLDAGETALEAALREADEEIGLDPSTVDIVGRLATMCTMANPAPIVPFVGALPARPVLRPNPAEVERAFSVSLDELNDPEVYREELWTFPDGEEREIHFFELVGDTVWGATARMLYELLGLVFAGT
jgi:8-oxo-dGTP pyrophosphatase MutT (NUDIX family)